MFLSNSIGVSSIYPPTFQPHRESSPRVKEHASRNRFFKRQRLGQYN